MNTVTLEVRTATGDHTLHLDLDADVDLTAAEFAFVIRYVRESGADPDTATEPWAEAMAAVLAARQLADVAPSDLEPYVQGLFGPLEPFEPVAANLEEAPK